MPSKSRSTGPGTQRKSFGNGTRFDPYAIGNMKPSRMQRQQKRGWKRGRK